MTYKAARRWEADLSFDLALLLKDHWEKLVIAIGGVWYVAKELLARLDKKSEARAAEKAAAIVAAKTYDEMAREGVSLAFASMKGEIERLSKEVSGLNERIDTMQQEFTAALLAKDADLRAAQAEARQLRADNDALHRTLAKCAALMAEAGLEAPIVPKVFQAMQVNASGDITPMGS